MWLNVHITHRVCLFLCTMKIESNKDTHPSINRTLNTEQYRQTLFHIRFHIVKDLLPENYLSVSMSDVGIFSLKIRQSLLLNINQSEGFRFDCIFIHYDAKLLVN